MSAPGGSDRVARAELSREGDYWSVVFAERQWRVRDSKGMRCLAELLGRPNVEIPALTLSSTNERGGIAPAEAAQAGLTTGAGTDSAPVLDARAKAAYRDRLRDLQAELDEAEGFHDPERAERARAEYAFVADELSSAVGLSGRDRRTGTPEERARVNVTRTVKAAIAHLEQHDHQLGEYLAATVLTGRTCVYRPGRADAVEWRVRARPQPARLERRFDPPKTQYARSGTLSIAYQVLGEGPVDVVLMYGWLSHLDFVWTDPVFTRFLRRLAQFARVIVFDKRGCGLSDPVGVAPTLEERIDDIRAVMDAAGSERAAVIGYSEGGAIAALFAAAHPERAAALVMYETWVCALIDPEQNPGGEKWLKLDRLVRAAIDRWGEGATLDFAAPTIAGNVAFRRLLGTFERASMSPGMAAALWESFIKEDIRPILNTIHVPTLIIHHTDSTVPVENARYAAEHISEARYLELAGQDHAPFTQDMDRIADEIGDFLRDTSSTPDPGSAVRLSARCRNRRWTLTIRRANRCSACI